MSNIEHTIFCNGCGAEVTLAPIVKGTRQYCCEDCLAGRGCECATRQDLNDDRYKNPHNQSSPSLTGTP